MEEKDLRKMMERFFDAALSIGEERELCRYLRENDVPAELRKDKEIIIALCGEPVETVMPEGAAERLESMLDELENCSTQDAANQKEIAKGKRKLIKIPRYIANGAVAASIIAATYLFFPTEGNVTVLHPHDVIAEVPEKDTFDNPEDALRCFKAACGDMRLACSTVQRNMREAGNDLKESFAPYNSFIDNNRK